MAIGKINNQRNKFTPGKLYIEIIHASEVPKIMVINATATTIIKEFTM